MTEEILKQKFPEVTSLRLVPSSGGVFEVTANGRLLFSKKATGRKPEPSEVLEAFTAQR